jgi:uncharacterized membrane protein YcaP (DUF421 family)
MFIVLLRTAILYILVVFSMRIMGKRQIGQLQPFELVIAIMISDLASLPMQDTRIPLLHGIIPIITLLVLQVALSLLQVKNEKAREIIDGKPSILIKNGKLNINNLKDQRFTVNEIMEELRINGFFNISDIQYATLETNGQLSVIPKAEKEPVTKKDMNISAKEQSMPVILIGEGKINYENLSLISKDETWLKKQLKDNNISKIEDLFIALLDSNSKFFYQYKDKSQ